MFDEGLLLAFGLGVQNIGQLELVAQILLALNALQYRFDFFAKRFQVNDAFRVAVRTGDNQLLFVRNLSEQGVGAFAFPAFEFKSFFHSFILS